MLLQTPQTTEICESPEQMKQMKQRNGYQNGTKYNGLMSQVMHDPKCKHLLPTPLAVEVSHSKRVKELKETGATQFHSRANGETRPNGLMEFLEFHDLLPTPRTCSAMGAALDTEGQVSEKRFPNLETVIARSLLKTPCAMDCSADLRKSKSVSGTSGTLAQEIASGYVEKRGWILPTPTAIEGEKYTNTYNPNSQMGKSLSAMAGSGMLSECAPENDGQPFRLSPLFTEEMMGFPLMWTALPFFSENGEPNP